MSDIQKRFLIFLVVLAAAIMFLLPTAMRSSFKDVNWVSKPLSLGLDLSGGVHLVYEVKAAEAVKSRLQSISNSLRSEFRDAKVALVKARTLDDNTVEFTFLSDQVAEKARTKIQEVAKDLIFKEKSPDGDRMKLSYGISDVFAERVKVEAINQSVETLRNRVDQFGVTEPLIRKIGADRVMLQMPGVSDIQSVRKVVGNVAKLEFRLLPLGAGGERTVTLKDKSGASVPVEDEALMTGDVVTDARVAFDQGVSVSLTLNNEGARLFRKITSENVGRSLAIILDGIVYSSPRINEPIGGGQASISGGFTVEEARQLAVVLRAGALPAPLEVLEERTVGPSLGAESIRKGIMAIIGGFVMVACFMIFWYKKSGLIAVGSLLLNLFLVVAALAAFGATLTLPGLAALALTVGVAVDSNVLIFERIKDELWNGATRDSAVRAGFEKAYSAILDANLAAFFTGLILYFLGTGPIKGFAVSLCVGIVTTMFCGVFVARLAFDHFKLKGGKFGLSV